MPKPEPKPELTYELEGAPRALFVVWSPNLEMYLAQNGVGFTPQLVGAGTFSETRAAEFASDQNIGSGLTALALVDQVRAQCAGANPVVLQAIAALGAR
jgi:hypothetical protein